MKKAYLAYYQTYKAKEILLSLLTGFCFSLFIMAPIMALSINLWLLFIYRLYFFSFVLILCIAFFAGLLIFFTHRTLNHYRKAPQSLRNKIMTLEISIAMGIIILIGLILMLMLIPMYT